MYRKSITLLFFLAVFFFSHVASTEAFTISKSINGNNLGLIGYWTFNGKDMPNGSVKDVSGMGNHGSVVGMATSSMYVLGKVGQALNYDGTDDCIALGAPSNLDMIAPLTVSAWVNLRNAGEGSHGRIISKADGNTANGGWFFAVGAGNANNRQMRFMVDFDTTDLDVLGPVAAYPLLEWAHLVVTWDGTGNGTGVSMYVNGESVSTTIGANGSASRSNDTGTTVQIGNNACGSASRTMDGFIDEVRLYSRVLTNTEIESLYNQGAENINKSSTGILNNSGLLAHWTFDGKDMLTGAVIDQSGNGHKGTLVSMSTSTSRVEGRIGQGLDFDGVDDQITAADTTDLSFGNGTSDSPLTFSAWVKRDVTGVNSPIITKTGGTATDTPFEYYFYINSSNQLVLTLYDSNGVNQISTRSASSISGDAGVWNHYVATYNANGSNTGISLYRNGVFISTTATAVGTYVAMENSPQLLRIGAAFPTDGSNKAFMNGQIDDVRVYSRVLTTAEIKDLYNHGSGKMNATSQKISNSSGLVGHWTFDGKDMPSGSVRDVSGQANHGSQTNMSTSTAYTEGKIGQALNFDGVDDFINVGSGSSLDDLPSSSGLSFSLWVKLRALGPAASGQAFIIAKETTSSGGLGWLFQTTETNDLLRFKAFFSGTDLNVDTALNTFSFSDIQNQWMHLAVTWTGSTSSADTHIYLNGSELSYSSLTDATGTYSSDAALSLLIGDALLTSNRNTEGAIDDVRVYNRVLSAGEIKQIYNSGK